jgi:hypothetical protein
MSDTERTNHLAVKTGPLTKHLVNTVENRIAGTVMVDERWKFDFDNGSVSGHISVKRYTTTGGAPVEPVIEVRVSATSDRSGWQMIWKSNHLISTYEEARYYEFLPDGYAAAVEESTGLDMSDAVRPDAAV